MVMTITAISMSGYRGIGFRKDLIISVDTGFIDGMPVCFFKLFLDIVSLNVRSETSAFFCLFCSDDITMAPEAKGIPVIRQHWCIQYAVSFMTACASSGQFCPIAMRTVKKRL
jgi:hypothetical protein